MSDTLAALESGQLIGATSLKLACGLTTFPDAIISLADTLEVLDLSDNHINEIPDSIAQLKQLRILFFARNKFTEFPDILKDCPALTMIGFKSNQIESVPENAFPPLLNWLILTDNQIEKIPDSIGDSKWLQKCALAGNKIEALPIEMANCKNLELLRISANQLREIPKWLFELPKLSWVAFGGNPASHASDLNTDIIAFDSADFRLEHILGEGASGIISKAKWKSANKDVAIKIFRGDVTSDGLPDDEMEIAIAAGSHPHLIPILGKIKNHPDQKIGLIMDLISPTYRNLGNPPSLESCTRDVFDYTSEFTESELINIAKSMASVALQLHSKGINHGDFYAHNILVNHSANSLLGDFGAASFYDINSDLAANIERVEIRAYGCLIEDLLTLVKKMHSANSKRWLDLIDACMTPQVYKRPNFSKIVKLLSTFDH